jgi:hypothetical protein
MPLDQSMWSASAGMTLVDYQEAVVKITSINLASGGCASRTDPKPSWPSL